MHPEILYIEIFFKVIIHNQVVVVANRLLFYQAATVPGNLIMTANNNLLSKLYGTGLSDKNLHKNRMDPGSGSSGK
jgi:hypothetical protein